MGTGSCTPTLAPAGGVLGACRRQRVPLLPEFVDTNTVTGQFVVEPDRYVDR